MAFKIFKKALPDSSSCALQGYLFYTQHTNGDISVVCWK